MLPRLCEFPGEGQCPCAGVGRQPQVSPQGGFRLIKADLHLHTTASDGVHAPQELVRMAAQQGFNLIAVTDHDSVDGLLQAQEEGGRLGVRVLSGVELGCTAHREVHVLGYGFDPQNETLRRFCESRVTERERRAQEMVRRLCEADKEISMDRVRELAKGVIARPHIARALVEAGHAPSVKDAFDRFLTPGRPTYVPREKVTVGEGIRLIHEAGGVAVLAHPMELKMGETMLESLVEEWKAQGLDGVEVYHPSAANNHAAFLHGLARRLGLLVTGGSDFHGEAVRKTGIGEGLDRFKTMESDVGALLARMRF